MPQYGDPDFNYEEYFESLLNSLAPPVREALNFIAHNNNLNSFMGDLVFNRGEVGAAKALYKRMKEANAPDYLLAMITLDDLTYITVIYNYSLAQLLRNK